MENKTKELIKIPLVSIWYVILTLIFILMKVTNIIDWSPLWILSPLWIPLGLAIGIFALIYIVFGIIYVLAGGYIIILEFIKKVRKKNV